jgi:hypothetical protein
VCQLHMRRFTDGTPSRSSPGGRRRFQWSRTWWWTERLRPDHPVRRLHVGEHGRRSRRQRDTRVETRGRGRHGRGAVHRLRSVCRRVQKRVRRPCSRPPRSHTSGSCPRAGSRPGAASLIWWNEWTPKASGPVRTKGNVRRSAPRASRSPISGCLNREYWKAVLS